MTQEDKELLLKDLCARLPYGVKCYNMFSEETCELAAIELDRESTLFCFWDKRKMFYHQQTYISEFKPYLFPHSSMTEEQKQEMSSFDPFQTEETKTLGGWAVCLVDFYNKHHFDYHGLIEKGLAIDATGLNIY